MNLEYLIDNSNINNVKKFILENNTGLKKEILKKPGKLKIFLEVSFVTFIILIPMFILSVNYLEAKDFEASWVIISTETKFTKLTRSSLPLLYSY